MSNNLRYSRDTSSTGILSVEVTRMLEKIKKENEDLTFGRDTIVGLFRNYCNGNRVLDIGIFEGTDLINIKNASPGKQLELHGIDWYWEYAFTPPKSYVKDPAITTTQINVENTKLPYPDGFFDCVLSNQTLEHMKEIFFVFSEISRVLKPGGIFIIGVPNLASWYNRWELLCGRQPSAIVVWGGHTRGFTYHGLKRALEMGNYFKLSAFKGMDFVPLPRKLNMLFSRLFPRLSNSLYFCFTRTPKKGNYISSVVKSSFSNNYFLGEEHYRK